MNFFKATKKFDFFTKFAIAFKICSHQFLPFMLSQCFENTVPLLFNRVEEIPTVTEVVLYDSENMKDADDDTNNKPLQSADFHHKDTG